MQISAKVWARHEFGATGLGDARRTRRLVTMAAGAALHPGGKVSVVYKQPREREGAYDFLENEHVDPGAVADSVFSATVRRLKTGRLYVPLDGSSLTLPDAEGTKGFGPVGSPNCPATGLIVMTALGVDTDGVPHGLLDQIFWSRPPRNDLTRAERVKRNAARRFEEKEPAKFVEAARNTIARLKPVASRPWFVIDREADNIDILLALMEEECDFTIRGRSDRRVRNPDVDSVQEQLDNGPSLGRYTVESRQRGSARKKFIVDVRAAEVAIRYQAYAGRPAGTLRLTAVRIRDVRGAEDGPDWLLYTNTTVTNADGARRIVESYETRWRIEEFHRTWKQGHCNVEDAQLHSEKAMIIWATILASVAMRIERLKYLSRAQPDQPASIELTSEEIEALKLDQGQRWTKRKRLPAMPSIAQATGWVAELGGWIGTGNGPPGSITIARGLERLGYLVEGIALARRSARA